MRDFDVVRLILQWVGIVLSSPSKGEDDKLGKSLKFRPRCVCWSGLWQWGRPPSCSWNQLQLESAAVGISCKRFSKPRSLAPLPNQVLDKRMCVEAITLIYATLTHLRYIYEAEIVSFDSSWLISGLGNHVNSAQPWAGLPQPSVYRVGSGPPKKRSSWEVDCSLVPCCMLRISCGFKTVDR